MPIQPGRFFVRWSRALILLAGVGLGCGHGGKDIPIVYTQNAQFDETPKMVMIISFDGLRPDAIAAADATHLMSLSEVGTRATSAHTVVPSLTLPSHTSMLTGVGVEKHAVTWNGWEPARGLVRVSTIFDEAKKSNLRTAMVVGKEKFRHLDHPGSLDAFAISEAAPMTIAGITERIIEEVEPHLIFVHFSHADTAGHRWGWMSAQQLEAIRDTDQALGHLLRYLQKKSRLRSTAVITTADHGGSGNGHGDSSEVSTSIPWFAVGAGVPKGATLTTEVSTYDTAATAAKLLGVPAPDSWDGKSVL